MKQMFKKLILLFLTMGSFGLNGHGFGGWTFVRFENSYKHMDTVNRLYRDGENLYVTSRHMDYAGYRHNYVRACAQSDTNCYFSISFGSASCGSMDIWCTPDQEFYNPLTREWVPAFKLKAGDVLLAEDERHETISCVKFIKNKLTVYAIEVDDFHNYFVGSRAVLTHNLAFPIVATFSLSASFGAGGAAGGTAGSFFGPVTFAGGFIIGGLIGVGIYALSGRDKNTYGAFYNTGDIEQYLRKAEQASGDKGKAGANSGNSGSSSDGDKGKKPESSKPQDGQKNPNEEEGKKTPNQEATEEAEKLGYKPDKNPPFDSHGKPAFRKGEKWISPDRDQHNGGTWKVYDKNKRIGTFDQGLKNKIR